MNVNEYVLNNAIETLSD